MIFKGWFRKVRKPQKFSATKLVIRLGGVDLRSSWRGVGLHSEYWFPGRSGHWFFRCFPLDLGSGAEEQVGRKRPEGFLCNKTFILQSRWDIFIIVINSISIIKLFKVHRKVSF